MLPIPAGEFEPGSTQGYPEERPQGKSKIKVRTFWMDRTEVTRAQFAAFVHSTAYVTEAELQGGAAVFREPASADEVTRDGDWWHYMPGASWQHPEGPDSNIHGRENEPVGLVTQKDALAYAHWLKRDLPTEAQWEWAARGNGQGEQLERDPRDKYGKPTANYWQGIFPVVNSREDGFSGSAPVGCFPVNGYGLHDMIGNVWEWTKDAFAGQYQGHGNGDPFSSLTRTGATVPRGKSMVIKGGSFLCSADYCVRYRTAARYPQEANLAAAHVGFRTVSRN